MWISRYRWESLVQRVERCEKAIRDQRDEKIYDTSKRILWNPKELSDETENIKWSKKYIDGFYNS